MIVFSCPKCGRTFQMGRNLAGRVGQCKSCGAAIVVPQPDATSRAATPTPSVDAALAKSPKPSETQQSPAVASASIPLRVSIPGWGSTNAQSSVRPVTSTTTNKQTDVPTPKLSPRLRRLTADATQVAALLGASPRIRVLSTHGQPPERYVVQYNVRSLARGPAGAPVSREEHVVEIQLTSEYPRQSPKCKMMTPIFHPNIEPAAICVGDHWTAGERLVDLIVRIGEMIAYQAYNVKSPLDGEAAMWTDQNRSSLPIDSRDIRPPELS